MNFRPNLLSFGSRLTTGQRIGSSPTGARSAVRGKLNLPRPELTDVGPKPF